MTQTSTYNSRCGWQVLRLMMLSVATVMYHLWQMNEILVYCFGGKAVLGKSKVFIGKPVSVSLIYKFGPQHNRNILEYPLTIYFYITLQKAVRHRGINTVKLHLPSHWLSGLPITWIGLALRTFFLSSFFFFLTELVLHLSVAKMFPQIVKYT